MLFDKIPSKYFISSLGANSLILGAFVFQGVWFDKVEPVSLHTADQGSVAVFFESQPEEIQKELKKQIKKVVRQRKKEISEFGEKIVESEKVVRQVNLQDLKKLQNLSPELKAFLKELQDEISQRQVYPYSAQRLRQTGRVVVKFDIISSGEIINVQVDQKSDFQKLDESAFELIAGIPKLNHVPKEVTGSDKMSITVPVEYNL